MFIDSYKLHPASHQANPLCVLYTTALFEDWSISNRARSSLKPQMLGYYFVVENSIAEGESGSFNPSQVKLDIVVLSITNGAVEMTCLKAGPIGGFTNPSLSHRYLPGAGKPLA